MEFEFTKDVSRRPSNVLGENQDLDIPVPEVMAEMLFSQHRFNLQFTVTQVTSDETLKVAHYTRTFMVRPDGHGKVDFIAGIADSQRFRSQYLISPECLTIKFGCHIRELSLRERHDVVPQTLTVTVFYNQRNADDYVGLIQPPFRFKMVIDVFPEISWMLSKLNRLSRTVEELRELLDRPGSAGCKASWDQVAELIPKLNL